MGSSTRLKRNNFFGDFRVTLTAERKILENLRRGFSIMFIGNFIYLLSHISLLKLKHISGHFIPI